MSADESFKSLEKNLHAALGSQPLLRAPSSLEQRVRAEMARRAARPWWQRSFASWPLPARAVFFVLSGGAAFVSVAVAIAMLNGPGAELVASGLAKFSALRIAARSLAAAAFGLLGGISKTWYYLGGAVIAAAYAGLLGLGATAYRLLWISR